MAAFLAGIIEKITIVAVAIEKIAMTSETIISVGKCFIKYLRTVRIFFTRNYKK